MNNLSSEEEFLSNLSNAQRDFVKFNSNNVLVSASAGSGKTFTMISKLVDLLVYYDVDVLDLLVVTFTNSAGEELKQKLHKELLKEINRTNNEDVDKTLLYEKLEKINMCDIGTLHSICYKYVLKYFYKCNISPSSTIISEEDVNYLITSSIDKVLLEYADDENFYALFSSYLNKRNNIKVINILRNIYTFTQSLPDVEAFKENIINNKDNLNNIDTNISANYILYILKSAFNECEKEFIELKSESLALGLDKYYETIDIILNSINEYKQCPTFSEASKYVYNGFIIPTRRKGKSMDAMQLDFVERYGKLKEGFNKIIKNLKDNFINPDYNKLLENEALVTQNVNFLLEIVAKIDEEYKKAKQQIDGLDYNDLEHLMLKILDDEKVLQELRSKYKYIFVDEYQDINDFQEQILLKLSNGKNLYMIGDVKQSIYGFRQCTPDIFIEKYITYKKNNLLGTSIDLNKNYRSIDNILQFVNYVFNIIGTSDTIGIDYKNTSMLECGQEVKNNFDDDKSVELNFLIKDNLEEVVDSESEDDRLLEQDKLEAQLVVQKIKEYLNKKYYDFEKKKLVKIENKDIAVLIRDKGNLMSYVYSELIKENIPVETELKLDLLSTYEIGLLVSYLKLLSNFNDDLAIITVLKSSIVDLSEDELFNIRINHNDNKDSFCNAVLSYINNNDDKVAFKIKEFLKELNEFKFKLNLSTLKELTIDIITKYNLENIFLSYADGLQKLKNVELFLNLLDNRNYERNLTKFLAYVELLKDKSYSCNIKSGANAVTIMTMHKSKGLDYPVVILAGLGKAFSNQSLREDTILSKELGVGIKYNDINTRIKYMSLSFMANKLRIANSEKKEQIRLLYVALTRAKNYLCLIGGCNFNNINKIKYKDILKCNSFMELILLSLLKNQFNFEKLLTQLNVEHKTDKLSFAANIVDIRDIESGVFDNKYDIAPNSLMVDTDIVNKLKSDFMYIYPYSNLSKIALKTSVTAMMNNEDYVEQNAEPKELKINESRPDNIGIKIGNAYHLIMENIDYQTYNSPSDLTKILDKLYGLNLIEEDVRPKINLTKIDNAINVIKELISSDTAILKEQQFILKDKHSKLVDNSNEDVKVMVQGVIDLILINGDKATIIDFKTNNVKDDEELKQKYKLQIKLYKIALEEAKKLKIENCYLYSFNLNKLIKM